METTVLRLNLADALGMHPVERSYLIAGESVRSDVELPLLAAFETTTTGVSKSTVESTLCFKRHQSTVDGWLAGDVRRVELRVAGNTFGIRIAGVCEFQLDTARGEITLRSKPRSVPVHQWIEALLGPPFAVVLACRNKWLLHAGAVVSNDVALAILGDSGVGKSTLVAWSSRHPHLKRVSDDILAVHLDDRGMPRTLPFPQLKLPEEDNDSRSEATLAFLLELILDNAQEPFSAHPAKSLHAILALTRHTVGLRLMPKELHEKHLEFATGISLSLKYYRGVYSHSKAALQRFDEWIQDDTRFSTKPEAVPW